ncbi:MAG: hypothetical protein JXA30_07705 [Deltaproteobacteria bacterium]|nr:hypothetical protein [Deltaproteobacteria bacterium]
MREEVNSSRVYQRRFANRVVERSVTAAEPWSNASLLLSLGAALLLCLLGCSTHLIPNTYVEDTEENREILAFVDSYRRAVESRNMGAVLAMVSKNYFDDMGTPVGDDDIDYETLRKGLERLTREVLATRYQISYRGIDYVDNRILVDILYTGWFQVQTDEGPQWRRRLQSHRLVLAREQNSYRILSGI